jgi:putative membrane protein insertion efficiency factor
MTPGALATAATRGIRHYQHSAFRHRVSGCCRFSPSCSAYALQALQRRRFPMAVLLIVWRVLRCNPLTRAGTFDPVRPARPRAVARAVAVLGLSGLTTLLVAGTADAVGTPGVHRQTVPGAMAGGCQGFVGGVAVERLDQDHPLQVYKGQRIVVTGVAPGGLATTNAQITSTTTADIYFIENLAKVTDHDTSTGTKFQDSTNVDNYLKYGSGIYRVDVRSVASPGWNCSATFYVQLHGEKFAAELAVAVGALGTVGMMAAVGGGKPPPSGDLEMTPEGIYDPGVSPEQLERQQAKDEAREKLEKDTAMNLMNRGLLGCLVAVLFAILGFGGGFPAAAAPVAAGGRSGKPRRIWVKGHPVLGFFSGLVAGLGITVALQQYAVYPLTIASGIVAPLVVAVLGAVAGRRGTAWVAR